MQLDTECIRLTRAQIELIRPGLADLVSEYHYVGCTGSHRLPRVDRKGRPIELQLPPAPQFAVITSAKDKLSSLEGRVVSLSVTALELLAFILGVNLTERILRPERSLRQTREHRKKVRCLILQLENCRRRALARYLEVHGPEEYSRVHQEWQATVRALRCLLVPANSAVQSLCMTQTACASAATDGECHPSQRQPQTADHWTVDLSFLDDPAPTPGNPRQKEVIPAGISGSTGIDRGAADNVQLGFSEPAIEEPILAERERTEERSTAVAKAVIRILEQAPDLFRGDRMSVAGHLARFLTDTESRNYGGVIPRMDVEDVIRQCKPRRAAVLDGPTTLNFYMSWLLRAMNRLAPHPEMRRQVARIIQEHEFTRVHASAGR